MFYQYLSQNRLQTFVWQYRLHNRVCRVHAVLRYDDSFFSENTFYSPKTYNTLMVSNSVSASGTPSFPSLERLILVSRVICSAPVYSTSKCNQRPDTQRQDKFLFFCNIYIYIYIYIDIYTTLYFFQLISYTFIHYFNIYK